MNPGWTFLDIFLSFLLWLPWERPPWKLWVLVGQQKAFRRDQATRASGRQRCTDARGQPAGARCPKASLGSAGEVRSAERSECQLALQPTQRDWHLWRLGQVTSQLAFLAALLISSARFTRSEHFASKDGKTQLFVVRGREFFPRLTYVHVPCGKRLNGNEKDRAGLQHFIASLG